MKETIQEVRLNIDSYDRDVTIYPNPFDYVVNLGPIVNSGLNIPSTNKPNIKQELKDVLKNNNRKKNSQASLDLKEEIFVFNSPELIVEYTNNLKKINNPYLNRNFDNVKFIRLDAAVIPTFTTIIINKDWDYCREHHHNRTFIKDHYDRMKDYTVLNYRYIPDDTNNYITINDRFLQIYIKEIHNNYNLGTNPVTDKSFIIIFDKIVGVFYWRGVPYSAVQTYKDSLLGEVNKLTIKFYDSWGQPLTINTQPINYETTQIINTDLLNPELLHIQDFVLNPKATEWIIEKITNILKCFIIINFNIKLLIPFYTPLDIELTEQSYTSSIDLSSINDTTTDDINNKFPQFNVSCENFIKIVINQNTFKVDNLYKELNDFVSTTGFIVVKKKTRTGKTININIDQYINNVIWFDTVKNPKEFINFNLESFTKNYKNYGFNILDKLKNEIINIPINKLYQNFLTFVMGVYTNELNTKTDFTSS
jgi:hypothetical protein